VTLSSMTGLPLPEALVRSQGIQHDSSDLVGTPLTDTAVSIERGPIDLSTPLSFDSSFRFPLQSAASRRDLWIGAALLLLPGIGWLLNMGHRIEMVHRMLQGEPAWPSWTRPLPLLHRGVVTFGGMLYYYLPGLVIGLTGYRLDRPWMLASGIGLCVLATLAIPGYMTHYCRAFDPREIYNPFRALSRVRQGGRAYWHAWAIALTALVLSFLGLLGAGVGFLVSSVWFWQVAGFSFARVFSPRPSSLAHPTTVSRADSMVRGVS
jgi:hypothetical protein